MNTKEELKAKLLELIPYMKQAIAEANTDGGKAHIGILQVKPDDSGRIVGKFRADEFFKDLSDLLDAPEITEEDKQNYEATKFLSKLNL